MRSRVACLGTVKLGLYRLLLVEIEIAFGRSRDCILFVIVEI